jgi:hypothetical protein
MSDRAMKAVARQAVKDAVKSGRLPRAHSQRCVDCGGVAREYHHHAGYEIENALRVVAICRSCHSLRTYPPKPITHSRFILALDQWRQKLNLSHLEMVKLIGRDATEWSHMVRGRRHASRSFIGAALRHAKVTDASQYEVLASSYLTDIRQRLGGAPWAEKVAV